MAHPRRHEAASAIRDSCPELAAEVVLDPAPDGPPSPLRTARLAWAAVRQGATHHLLLQDDLILCDGFADAVASAVAAAPSRPLAFFTSWGSRTAQLTRLAALTGRSWAPVVDRFVPPQALVLPASLVEQFVAYAGELGIGVTDGRAITTFLAEHKLIAQVSTPNLVEHETMDSLLGHHIMLGPRGSVAFPRRGGSPLLAFDGSVLEPVAVPHYDSGAGYAVVFPRHPAETPSGAPPAHNVLGQAGMMGPDITDAFLADIRRNPSAEPSASGFAYPFTFQMWLTVFVLGTVLSSLFGTPEPERLDAALEQPWAREALGTFPAGPLHRLVPEERLAAATERFTPLCMAALRSGFVATARWPRLIEIAHR